MGHYLKKELYELIKEDESIFDFIQDSSLDGLWYWDLENPENEWMNAKFWTVLGYNPDEKPHKSSAWQTIINQDDLKVAIDNFNKHCENPNHPYDQTVRYTHKNGSTLWIRCRGLAIRDKNGINQYKSPNVTKLFGWKPEELIGKSTWDIVHPDDLEAGQRFIDT
ncbi:MAG: PAS domain-containing protein, partial [bacterium]